MAAVTKTDLLALKDKLERRANLAIQLVDGVRKYQLVGGLETENVGLHLNLTSRELDRFYAEIPPSRRLAMANKRGRQPSNAPRRMRNGMDETGV